MRSQAHSRAGSAVEHAPALGPDQVRAFFEIGFVAVSAVFAPVEIARMRAAFERLRLAAERLGQSGMWRGSQFVLERTASGLRIERIVWCGAAEPVLSRYGQDPRLLRMAAQLLGSEEMAQLINQAHFKLPGDGVEFPWHQDSIHRRYGRGEWADINGRGSYVQSTIALDEVTAESGPLEFIPGSCRLGHVEPAPGGQKGRLPAALAEASRVAPTMRAGDVLLFGPYTFHRSLPNRSGRPRRVFINGFAYPGANSRAYPGDGAGRLVRVTRNRFGAPPRIPS